MIAKVRKTAEENGLFPSGAKITAAVSGGADSMSLLCILNTLKDEYGFSLTAAHFNHKLRGAEADRDENFVKKECEKLGIPLFIGSADVKKYAKEHSESTELAARNLRYEFFESLDTDFVATAHNNDDNLETVIMNLSRGSALKGLCGVPVKRGKYIRPLLYCTRAEIENYCSENGIDFVTDSTNLTDDCTRNIIRHNAVPVLKSLNPNVCESLNKTVSALKADEEFIGSIAGKIYALSVSDGKLSAEKFKCEHKAVKSRVAERYLRSIGAETDFYHIDKLLELADGKFDRLSVSNGITLKNSYGIIAPETDKKAVFVTEIEEKSPAFLKKDGKVNNLLLKNSLDCDKIIGHLTVRTRLEGDKITFAHRKVSKSLKKLFIEDKIPLYLRDSIPVIADDNGVVWVYGYGADKRVLPDGETRSIYYIDCNKTL